MNKKFNLILALIILILAIIFYIKTKNEGFILIAILTVVAAFRLKGDKK